MRNLIPCRSRLAQPGRTPGAHQASCPRRTWRPTFPSRHAARPDHLHLCREGRRSGARSRRDCSYRIMPFPAARRVHFRGLDVAEGGAQVVQGHSGMPSHGSAECFRASYPATLIEMSFRAGLRKSAQLPVVKSWKRAPTPMMRLAEAQSSLAHADPVTPGDPKFRGCSQEFAPSNQSNCRTFNEIISCNLEKILTPIRTAR